MGSKILITGATGTVGAEVVNQLINKGIQFQALAHRPESVAVFNELGIEAFIGDLDHPETLLDAMEGIEKVFLLSPGSMKMVRRECSLIDVASTQGVKHVVKLGAMGTERHSPLNICRMHARIEDYTRDSKLKWTFIHPHAFMQNILQQVFSIIEHWEFYGNLASAKIPFIDARDIASLAVECLLKDEHRGKTYNITGPEPLSYYELADQMSQILKMNIRYENLSDEEIKNGMLQTGMEEWLADDLTEMGKLWRSSNYNVPVRSIRNVVGIPDHTFKDFLNDYSNLFHPEVA